MLRVLVRAAGVCLAAASLALPAVAADAAPTTDPCAALTLSVPDPAPPGQAGATAHATVPAALGRLSLPAGAFTLTAAGRVVPLAATRLATAEQTVVVALLATDTTSRADFDDARSAVAELFRGLPPDSRASLVLADGSRTPELSDRVEALAALARLPQPGSSLEAVQDLARVRASQHGRRTLVVVTDRIGVVRAAPVAGLRQLAFGAAQRAGNTDGAACPAPGSELLASVDRLDARLGGQYLLSLPEHGWPAAVTVANGAVRATAELAPPAAPAASSSAGRRAPTSRGPGALLPPLLFVVVLMALAVVGVKSRTGSSPYRSSSSSTAAGRPVPPAVPAAQAGSAGRAARAAPTTPRQVTLDQPAAPQRSVVTVRPADAPGGGPLGRLRTACAVAVLALTAALGWHVTHQPPDFNGSESLLLTAPRATSQPASGPALSPDELTATYLTYAPSLGVTAQVETRSLLEQRAGLLRAGLQGDYDVQFGDPTTTIQYVAPDLRQVAPVVRFTTRSQDAAHSRAALDLLEATARADLDARQQAAGAPVQSLIQVKVLAPATVLRQVPGSRLRASAAVALLALLGLRLTVRWGRGSTRVPS